MHHVDDDNSPIFREETNFDDSSPENRDADDRYFGDNRSKIP